MTKKKRGHPDVEEILARPWCYYCERDFDDLKILISHQKAKHFKCDRCGRRLNTAGGLSVHMSQVHKETLTTVENALPNRSDHNVEIFGMEGIPEEIVSQHNQRVTRDFYQAEAERRANTGNPAPGGNSAGGAPKKLKTETISDMKMRLAEHKARKTAQEAEGAAGNSTPISSGPGMASPGLSQSPALYQATNSPFTQPPFPQYDHTPQQGFPTAFSQLGFPPPPQQHAYPPQTSHFPQGMPGFPPPPHQFPPGQNPYPQMPMAPFPQYAGSQQPGANPPYGGGSPGFNNQSWSPQSHSPSQNGLTLARPPSLAVASGLPQKPAFVPPPVNAFQMQQMHQGHIPGQEPHLRSSVDTTAQATKPEDITITASSVDDLIADAAKDSSVAASLSKAPQPAIPAPTPAPAEFGREKDTVAGADAKKSGKKEKEKDKATKMIYSDNEFSPEEKMAGLERYRFDAGKERKEETVLDDATMPAVAGVEQGPDDVIDRSN